MEALSLFAVDGSTVKDLVLTHMHSDHVGNFRRLPNTQFHLQEVELHYTTGAICAIRFSPTRRECSSAASTGLAVARPCAESAPHIIPGHDPLVLRQYPAPRAALEGVVVCLDVMPRE